MSDGKCLWNDGLAGEFWRNGRLPFTVYDVHGHMGFHPAIHMSHAAPETMVRHLRRAGEKLIFTHHYALNDWSFRNAACVDIARRFPDDLRVYMAVNPHCAANIEEDLALYDSWLPYVCGLKLLADYHRVSVTDPRYEKALAFAEARHLPVLFHTWGGSGCNGAAPLLELTKRHPGIVYLFGHSIYGDWSGVERLRNEAPATCYFELTSIPGQAGYIERLLDTVGADRILFGTDLPWFDEFQAIGGVLCADIPDNAKRAILHDNARRIFGDLLPA
jgi:predicted TIM-barrel fold metal-dependent hydrolase